jgi:hypothetical protein
MHLIYQTYERPQFSNCIIAVPCPAPVGGWELGLVAAVQLFAEF